MTNSTFIPKTITVLGGGNSAFATSAELALYGHNVRLLELTEFSESIASIKNKRRILIEAPGLQGVPTGEAQLAHVTTDPDEAMNGTDVVFYVVPAYGEDRFTSLCLDYFLPSQLVVFFCGNLGGALTFAHHLLNAGRVDLPLILETDGLYFGGFKSGSTSVRLSGLKEGLVASTFPANRLSEGLRRLNSLFPGYEFLPAKNVIETGFRNMNPILHPPISVLNAGRSSPDISTFFYYREGTTYEVSQVMMRIDDERISVGKALELDLKSSYETLLKWYGWQGASGNSLYELLVNNPAYQSLKAPKTLNHRFITEDVPYGLVPISALGRSVNRSTAVIDSLITLASALLGQDMYACGRDLEALGLNGLDRDGIQLYIQGA